jgi:hypothetical protein
MSSPYCIVSSFLSGGSLYDVLHKAGPGGERRHLSGTQKTLIGMGIAHGMRYLHEHNVIHRNLKSSNILLDERLLPKIGDFALGRFLRESELGVQLTVNVGTPMWMAPEVLEEDRYGFEVDVYSYGLILYELYAERLPFSETNRLRLFDLVCKQGYRPELPDDTSSIGVLIRECWQTDPHHRPTFEEIYSRFEANEVSFPDTVLNGSSIFIREVQHWEEEHRVCIGRCAGELNEVRRLREREVSENEVQRQVVQCCIEGDLKHLHQLLVGCAHSSELINGKDEEGVCGLQAAVKFGQLHIVEYLVRLRPVRKNIGDEDGNTPLINAVRYGQVRIVGFLVQVEGVDVNAQNRFGMTALHVLSEFPPSWHVSMIQAFSRSRDLRFDVEDWDHKRPLWKYPELLAQLQSAQGASPCPKLS